MRLSLHLCQAQALKLFRANSDSLCHCAHDFSWNRFYGECLPEIHVKRAVIPLCVPSQSRFCRRFRRYKSASSFACFFFRAGIRQRSLNDEGSVRIPVSRYRSLRWFSPQMSTFLLSISVGIGVVAKHIIQKVAVPRSPQVNQFLFG